MLTKEQFEHLASRLIAKTAVRQVLWQAGQEFTSENKMLGREFDLQFPNSILSIGYFAPASEPDYVLLTISDNQGAVIGQRRVVMGAVEWDRAVELCTTA